jgi:hypothetical protein
LEHLARNYGPAYSYFTEKTCDVNHLKEADDWVADESLHSIASEPDGGWDEMDPVTASERSDARHIARRVVSHEDDTRRMLIDQVLAMDPDGADCLDPREANSGFHWWVEMEDTPGSSVRIQKPHGDAPAASGLSGR